MPDEEFTQIVDAHYAALYGFALSLSRRPADASDLTQQTFFVWARKGGSLRDPGKVKTWLFTTLYREFLRTRRREGRMTALEELPPPQQDVPDPGPDLVDKLDAQVVMEALQEVDPLFREPLALFYLEDLSYLEIADILSVPIGTVMSRLSRAKAQLRARLAARSRGGQVIEFPNQRLRA